MPTSDSEKRRQREMRAQEIGYKSTPGIRSVSLATDSTMARRVTARQQIRALVAAEFGNDALAPWEGDDLGTP